VSARIGIVVKADSEAGKKADALEAWLRNRQIDVVRKESLGPNRQLSGQPRWSTAPGDLRCILVLGGDGTFLSAVRWIGDQNIPILGIKFGEVGFLAEISEDRLFSAAEYILDNPFTTEPRMRLLVHVQRSGKEIACETVLNDVVINKGALARLATMKTFINERYLTTYRADGLIVATPTGSTAYSLAAGGPIIHPGVPGIILAPICPFTLTNRPLVVPDTAIIKIELAKKASNIMLTFDGQAGIEISDQDTIIVKKGPFPIQMIAMPGQNYFDVLKAKLNWSGYRV
jgi:NAD+ kinase